jgi:hypothetical protein
MSGEHEAPWLAAAQAMREAFGPLQAMLAKVAEQARQRVEFVRQAAAPLVAATQEAAKVKPRVEKYLAERGWYATFRFSLDDLLNLAPLIDGGDHEAVDRHMAAFAREGVGEVEVRLRERFPARAQIIADAFEAHRGGRYTLSVPTLLAQADGIGCDVIGVPRQFFQRPQRVEALQAKLAAFTLLGRPYVLSGVWKGLVGTLLDPQSAEIRTDKRAERQLSEPWFGPLNRHGVLHGHDTDYATEANSLRCVVLLEYLLDVDRILHQELPNELAELNEMWEKAKRSVGD